MNTVNVASSTVPQASSAPFFIMLVVFFIFLYFAVWRPQNKRAKEQQALLGALAKGDEVMTSGGLVGRVTTLGEQYVGLTVALHVQMFVLKSAIVSQLPKGTMDTIA
ncbi:MAG: preprotein translocase subunit YajC [Gammaproteobacteria bacterium RIFCSPHIGHO2_12_FULL_42_10]|nr:MAG: preprotein translocase subunit YajC [Gammaproteobacteria bacterium RIFCSPHIGHO2_12_FULL_42_10]